MWLVLLFQLREFGCEHLQRLTIVHRSLQGLAVTDAVATELEWRGAHGDALATHRQQLGLFAAV